MSSPPPPPHAWVVLVVLNLLSGLFSGLNLGLMSLTVEDLNIVIRSSPDKKQVQYAKRILPLRRRGGAPRLLRGALPGRGVPPGPGGRGPRRAARRARPALCDYRLHNHCNSVSRRRVLHFLPSPRRP